MNKNFQILFLGRIQGWESSMCFKGRSQRSVFISPPPPTPSPSGDSFLNVWLCLTNSSTSKDIQFKVLLTSLIGPIDCWSEIAPETNVVKAF